MLQVLLAQVLLLLQVLLVLLALVLLVLQTCTPSGLPPARAGRARGGWQQAVLGSTQPVI